MMVASSFALHRGRCQRLHRDRRHHGRHEHAADPVHDRAQAGGRRRGCQVAV